MVHPDLLKDIQRIDFMVCKIVGGLMAQRKAKRSMPTVKEMEFIMNGIITDNLKGKCDIKKANNMAIKKAGKRTVN